MGRIRVLPEVVASQVAAGEVVERPASVIKELLENSLDAGARHMEVEVRGAGTAMLRVTDDGAGMDREDALMALERHATSKISTAADLSSVLTMGFRGEALPSIASVSEFTLRTRPRGSETGTEVAVRGGKLGAVREAGCAPGTTIEVKSLFFNVPARRKFLRSAATETAHLDRAVETVALAFPAVALHYLRDGRTVHRLPAASNLAARVADLYGVEARRDLLEVPEMDAGGIHVSGLVSRPGVTRADRERQYFFVNGRAVESGFLASGLREAFRQMLEPGRHPSVFLHLRMDPGTVDCNVHPAKREVRFRSGGMVREAVREAVEAALREARAEWLRPLRTHVATRLGGDAVPAEPRVIVPGAHQPELPRPVVPAPVEVPVGGGAPPVRTPVEAPRGGPEEFRLIGGLSGRYLLLEGGEGLVLLDQRAAHQRILFERLQRGVASGAVASQRLLVPAVLELPPREHEVVAENLEVLAASGFAVEVFGGRSLKVEALPDFLAGRDPRRVLEDFAADFLAGAGPRTRGAVTEDAVRRAVARLTLDTLAARDEREQRELVTQLLSCELPYCDPDGRPVMLQFSWRDLDRKFGRL
ncbi:MAG: DNA mismatch repair endonuclease MutL [Chthoniobacterales bacterium]|nr:DNA mismatch repair endonuclease MutL [Chthoniobacterales bacterium]